MMCKCVMRNYICTCNNFSIIPCMDTDACFGIRITAVPGIVIYVRTTVLV